MPKVDPLISRVTVIANTGEMIPKATVVAVADNQTTKQAMTDNDGVATLTLPTRRQYRLLVAHANYPGAVIQSWDPKDDMRVTLLDTENRGSVILHSTGYIPGLEGRLNPILDTSQRTYIYAENIGINGGKPQPTTFSINMPFELEDSNGVVMNVRVLEIRGRTSLLEFVRPRYESTPLSTMPEPVR